MSVETWLQFTQYDTVQAMTEDKMEYCRILMAELILHEIIKHTLGNVENRIIMSLLTLCLLLLSRTEVMAALPRSSWRRFLNYKTIRLLKQRRQNLHLNCSSDSWVRSGEDGLYAGTIVSKSYKVSENSQLI